MDSGTTTPERVTVDQIVMHQTPGMRTLQPDSSRNNPLHHPPTARALRTTSKGRSSFPAGRRAWWAGGPMAVPPRPGAVGRVPAPGRRPAPSPLLHPGLERAPGVGCWPRDQPARWPSVLLSGAVHRATAGPAENETALARTWPNAAFSRLRQASPRRPSAARARRGPRTDPVPPRSPGHLIDLAQARSRLRECEAVGAGPQDQLTAPLRLDLETGAQHPLRIDAVRLADVTADSEAKTITWDRLATILLAGG